MLLDEGCQLGARQGQPAVAVSLHLPRPRGDPWREDDGVDQDEMRHGHALEEVCPKGYATADVMAHERGELQLPPLD